MDQDAVMAILRRHGIAATPQAPKPGVQWMVVVKKPRRLQGPGIHKPVAPADSIVVEWWMRIHENQRAKHFAMTAEQRGAYETHLSSVLSNHGVHFDLVGHPGPRQPAVVDLVMFRVNVSIPDSEVTDARLLQAIEAVYEAWDAGDRCIPRYLGFPASIGPGANRKQRRLLAKKNRSRVGRKYSDSGSGARRTPILPHPPGPSKDSSGDRGMTRFFSLPEQVRIPAEHGWILEMEREENPQLYDVCREVFDRIPHLVKEFEEGLPRKDRIRPVQWTLATLQTPGAFSTTVGKPVRYELICLSKGAIAAANDHFNRIMAHPDNMPSIGDPVKEKDSVPGASGLYASTLEQDWWRKSVQPHCPIRRHFAHLLTLMCLDLIVLHEYAHLTNGHVDYLDQVPDKDEPRRRQALEINADATSVLNILASTCAQHVLLRNGPAWPDANQQAAREIVFGTFQNCFRSILLSGYVFLRAFNRSWDEPSQIKLSHPGEAIRMKLLSDCLGQYIRNVPAFPGYTEQEYYDDAGRVYSWAEDAMARIDGKGRDLAMWKSAFQSEAANKYIEDLGAKWAEVGPQLEPFMKVDRFISVDWTIDTAFFTT